MTLYHVQRHVQLTGGVQDINSPDNAEINDTQANLEGYEGLFTDLPEADREGAR